MDPNTTIALLGNAGALPKGVQWRIDFGDDERDAYGKAVDVLDALGLIQSVDVNSIGEPYEILHVEGGLDISGPRGLMLASGNKEVTPTEALAGAIVPVVSEDEAEAVLNWARHKVQAATAERIMPGATNELMSEKAARVLLAILDTNEATVIEMPRRLHAVETGGEAS